MGKRFSIQEAIGFGWETVRANPGFLIGILILALIMQMMPNILSRLVSEKYPLLAFVIYLLGIFIQILIGMGLIKIALKFSAGEKARLEDLFSCAPLFLPYLGASILCTLAVLGGFILFIIPGIILAIRLQFCVYLIIDEHASAIQSLQQSFALTKGTAWDLFVFSCALFGVNMLGFLCFFIGLLATIPISMIAVAYVYRKLLQTSGDFITLQGSAEGRA